MKESEVILNGEDIELIAYRVISREVNRFIRTKDDAELGNFVKGVVALQMEIYKELDNDEKSDKGE